jgi:hypothetical protein
MHRGARFGLGFLGGAIGSGIGAMIVRKFQRDRDIDVAATALPSGQGALIRQAIEPVDAEFGKRLMDIGAPALVGGLLTGVAAALPE